MRRPAPRGMKSRTQRPEGTAQEQTILANFIRVNPKNPCKSVSFFQNSIGGSTVLAVLIVTGIWSGSNPMNALACYLYQ